MTDDLDTRIRSLVATAVADAPPAPEIDETTIRTAPSTSDDRAGSNRRWIAGGFAGLSVAAAIVALFLVSRPDEVVSPLIPATQPPTVPATAPVTTPEPADELTENPVVAVEPVTPFAAQVLYLTDEGVIGVDGDGEERAVTAEPMANAVLDDDGRIFAQRSSEFAPNFDPTMLTIEASTGEIETMTPPAEFDGLTPQLHDGAQIEGETVLLVTLRPEQCADGNNCIGQLVAWWPDSDEVRVVAERNVFEGSWDLPTLADNGLVVGTELDSATHAFFAGWVPGVGTADIPTVAELGLEEFYFDCEDCPNAFTTDASGRVVGWLETAESTDGLTLVIVEPGAGRAVVPLSGFADESPPSASRTQLSIPFAGFDIESGDLFGSFALASDVIGVETPAWFGSLLDGTVQPLDAADRVVFP